MMCVRIYVCMYVSSTPRNVVVTSCRNVAVSRLLARGMMRIRTPSTYIIHFGIGMEATIQ